MVHPSKNFLKFVENSVNFFVPRTANFSHRISELQHKICGEDIDFSTLLLSKLHSMARWLINIFGHTLTLQELAESAYSEEEKKKFVDEKDEILRRLKIGEAHERMDSANAILYFTDPQNGRVVSDAMSFVLTHMHLINDLKIEHAVVQSFETFLFSGWLQKRQQLASDDMQTCQDLQRKIHEFITNHIEMMDDHTLCEKMCYKFFRALKRLEIKATVEGLLSCD